MKTLHTLAIRADPLSIGTWLIGIAEGVLMGSSLVGSVLSSIGGDISSENGNIGKELSDFRVGEEELGDNTEVLDGFLSLRLGSLLVYWS